MFGVLGLTVALHYFADAFDRADGAPGNAWTQPLSSAWSIASNRLRRSASATDVLIYQATELSSGYAECVPLDDGIGPALRTFGFPLEGYCVAPVVGSDIALFRANPSTGKFDTILDQTASHPNLATDVVRIVAVGNLIQGYINSTIVLEATDGNYISGRGGIGVVEDESGTLEVDAYAEGEL